MLWSILFLSGGRGKPSPGPRRLPALIHSHLFFISSKAQCSFLSRGLCTCCPLCLCSLPSHPQPLHSTSTLTSAFSPDGHPNATSSGKCLLSLGVGGGGLGTQLCPTLCDPMGCSPPGSSVHRTSQARILEWVGLPFSRESSQPRARIQVSCIGDSLLNCRWILYWLSHQGSPQYMPPKVLLTFFLTLNMVCKYILICKIPCSCLFL